MRKNDGKLNIRRLDKNGLTTEACFEKIHTKGRPRLKLTAVGCEFVTRFASLMCTEEEIASVLGVTVEVLHNAENQETFLECIKNGQCEGKASLRRSQFELAKKNPSMAIFLGKNYLGQRDDTQGTLELKSTVTVPDALKDASLEELQKMAGVLSVGGSSATNYENEEETK